MKQLNQLCVCVCVYLYNVPVKEARLGGARKPGGISGGKLTLVVGLIWNIGRLKLNYE